MDGPRARLRNAQDLFAYLGAHDRARADAVARRLPAAVREQLEHGLGTAFWPLADDAAYVDAIVEVLGREAAERLWRGYARRLLELPLIRGFAQGALRLFGPHPGTLVTMFPRGWEQSYRDCGTATAERGSSHAILMLRELPEPIAARPGYVIVFEQTLRGLHDAIGVEPQLTVDVSPQARAMDFTADW